MLGSHRLTAQAIQSLSASRPGKRQELYRRLNWGRDFIHSNYQRPITIDDMAQCRVPVEVPLHPPVPCSRRRDAVSISAAEASRRRTAPAVHDSTDSRGNRRAGRLRSSLDDVPADSSPDGPVGPAVARSVLESDVQRLIGAHRDIRCDAEAFQSRACDRVVVGNRHAQVKARRECRTASTTAPRRAFSRRRSSRGRST